MVHFSTCNFKFWTWITRLRSWKTAECSDASYKNGLFQLQFEKYMNLCSLLFITLNVFQRQALENASSFKCSRCGSDHLLKLKFNNEIKCKHKIKNSPKTKHVLVNNIFHIVFRFCFVVLSLMSSLAYMYKFETRCTETTYIMTHRAVIAA